MGFSSQDIIPGISSGPNSFGYHAGSPLPTPMPPTPPAYIMQLMQHMQGLGPTVQINPMSANQPRVDISSTRQIIPGLNDPGNYDSTSAIKAFMQMLQMAPNTQPITR